jgi:hypothetical protein
MNTTTARVTHSHQRLSKRNADRFRQAVARRRIQDLRDEKILQGQLAEVWDELPSTIGSNSSIH